MGSYIIIRIKNMKLREFIMVINVLHQKNNNIIIN